MKDKKIPSNSYAALSIKKYEELMKSIAVFSAFYQREIDMIMETIPDFSKILPKTDYDKIIEMKRRYDNLEKSDFEFKWLGSLSIPFFNNILEIFEEKGSREAERYLIESLRDSENIETLKEWLKGHEAYSQRKVIIDDCLKAHLQGKFTLSIPVLLAQCDGVAIDSVNKKLNKTEKHHINMEIISKWGEIENKNLSKHMRYLYRSFRHGILHGRNKKYFIGNKGEALSARCIWTLFELINFSTDIKRNI